MNIFWARLASFGHFGLIRDHLIVSKFHNETHYPKGQENKIYTIVKDRETFYCRHTVQVTSCSEVKYNLKRVFFGSKECTKELKLKCAYFLTRLDSFSHSGITSDPLIVPKFLNMCVWWGIEETVPNNFLTLQYIRHEIMLLSFTGAWGDHEIVKFTTLP